MAYPTPRGIATFAVPILSHSLLPSLGTRIGPRMHLLGLQFLAKPFAQGEESPCGRGFATTASPGNTERKLLLLRVLHAG